LILAHDTRELGRGHPPRHPARERNLRCSWATARGTCSSVSLHHLVREAGVKHPYYDELAVVTLGAIVDVPGEFRRVHQYLGQLDFLGTVNPTSVPRTSRRSRGRAPPQPATGVRPVGADVLRKVPGSCAQRPTRRVAIEEPRWGRGNTCRTGTAS
jgi:hypothetical protein